MANSGTFRKGDGRTRKPVGAKNKVTQSMREAWLNAFNEIGGVPALVKWGKKPRNQTAFYSLASKLIPVDITSGGKELPAPTVIERVVIGAVP